MDKSRLYGNLDTEKSPLEGASASVEPRPAFAKLQQHRCRHLFRRHGGVLWTSMAQRKVQCSEMLRINILKGNIGRHLSWSARQQSDKALTSPQQREGTRSKLRYGAVACWSIIFGGSSFFLKCPNINIYIYTYIHNKHIIYIYSTYVWSGKLNYTILGFRQEKWWPPSCGPLGIKCGHPLNLKPWDSLWV